MLAPSCPLECDPGNPRFPPLLPSDGEGKEPHLLFTSLQLTPQESGPDTHLQEGGIPSSQAANAGCSRLGPSPFARSSVSGKEPELLPHPPRTLVESSPEIWVYLLYNLDPLTFVLYFLTSRHMRGLILSGFGSLDVQAFANNLISGLKCSSFSENLEPFKVFKLGASAVQSESWRPRPGLSVLHKTQLKCLAGKYQVPPNLGLTCWRALEKPNLPKS